jgi:hypothetical protein
MTDVDLTRLEAQDESLAGHVGDVSSFYLRMIATAEVAVELAGSACKRTRCACGSKHLATIVRPERLTPFH